MQKNQQIVILDFGGQYTQLIARRVRENNVFSSVVPYTISLDALKALSPVGVILSGGPASVLEPDAPKCDPALFSLGIPVLGICYGMQLMAVVNGGVVTAPERREYGKVQVQMDDRATLLKGMSSESTCWMSHTYQVTGLPDGFKALAHSQHCPIAAMADPARKLYGVQLHPEVTHTAEGHLLLHSFLYDICGCTGDWSMAAYAQQAIAAIQAEVGDTGTVLLGLSGGVDSSVAAALLYKAIGDRLTCVFVDHGLLRKGEAEQVVDVFTHTFPVWLIHVIASKRFFADLSGVTDPERKRKIIGADFVKVFKDEALKLGKLDHFAQGTIYPDVIESGAVTGSAVIKSHHNVGGLPKELGFTSLVEPLRMLFKDAVRRLGETLGLPHELVWRQPCPGPGLAIRIIGEVTPEKAAIVRESDAILREEVQKADLAESINQYFTVLTGIRSVGVMGDERTYDYTIALRAVTTNDFMTADWARIPYDTVSTISARIVNEVPHVNRVVMDVTTKPPASIEWE
ncbi:MAG: glutamine-hydrolyzing GMP synthase [Eubacteriales bacterium]|nr:glutamine-hydrolyzing GMP synthase [Eubacteriales bacterium]